MAAIEAAQTNAATSALETRLRGARAGMTLDEFCMFSSSDHPQPILKLMKLLDRWRSS